MRFAFFLSVAFWALFIVAGPVLACSNPSGVPGDMMYSDNYDAFVGCTQNKGWVLFHEPGSSDGTNDPRGFGIVGHEVSKSTGADPIFVDLPAGTQENDLLLAVIIKRDDTSLPSQSGWTPVFNQDFGFGASVRVVILSRLAPSSAPSGYNFDTAGASDIIASIFTISNPDTGNIFNDDANTQNTWSTRPYLPALSTSVADTLLFGVFAATTSSTFSAPVGYDLELCETQNLGLCVATRAYPTSGAVPQVDWTGSIPGSLSTWKTVHIALTPSP